MKVGILISMDLSTSVSHGSLVSRAEGAESDSFMLSVSMDDDDDHGLDSSVINRSEAAESVLSNIEGVPYLLDSDCFLAETGNLSQQVDSVYQSSAISLHSYSQVLPSIASECLHNYSQPISLPAVGANTEVLHNYSQPWPQSADSFTSVHNYCINNDTNEELKETLPQNEVKLYKLSNPNVEGADDPSPVCLKLQLVDSYVCKWRDCNMAFDTTTHLVEHTSSHIKVQPPGFYRCFWKNCLRKEDDFFQTRYRIVQHMRIHTAERPHKCSLCQAVFSSAEGLTKHQRVHTGEKPYPCTHPGCTKAFRNSGDRYKHVQTHKTKYPYPCKYPGCVCRYTDPGTLRRHMRRKHPPSAVKASSPHIEKRIQAATLLTNTGAETVLDVSELEFTNIEGSLYCEDRVLLASAGIRSQCEMESATQSNSAQKIQSLLTATNNIGGNQDSPLDLSNSISATNINSEATQVANLIEFNPLDGT